MRFFRRRRRPTPSVNTNPTTVGLDHIAARGVGGRPPARLIFVAGDTQWHTASWKMWREFMRDTYKLGVSRHRVITVAAPKEALVEIKTGADFNALRGIMFAQQAQALTPEDFTNA